MKGPRAGRAPSGERRRRGTSVEIRSFHRTRTQVAFCRLLRVVFLLDQRVAPEFTGTAQHRQRVGIFVCRLTSSLSSHSVPEDIDTKTGSRWPVSSSTFPTRNSRLGDVSPRSGVMGPCAGLLQGAGSSLPAHLLRARPASCAFCDHGSWQWGQGGRPSDPPPRPRCCRGCPGVCGTSAPRAWSRV